MAQNPKSSAFGLCQMISSTRELVEKQIGKINWQNQDEQLEACIWLYENSNKYREWLETRHLWEIN